MAATTDLSSDRTMDPVTPRSSRRWTILAGLIVLLIIVVAWLGPKAVELGEDPRVGWNPRVSTFLVDDGVVMIHSRVRTSNVRATVTSLGAPGVVLEDIVVLPDGPIPFEDEPPPDSYESTVAYLTEAGARPGASRGFPFTLTRGEDKVAVTLWRVVDCERINADARPVVTVKPALGGESTHTLRNTVQPAQTMQTARGPSGETIC